MSDISVTSKQSINGYSDSAVTISDTPSESSLLPQVPSIAGGSDPAAEISALLVKLGQTQKQGDEAVRNTAEATEDAQESKQVSLMRDKASDMSIGGWVTGGIDLASATCSVASVATSNVSASGVVQSTKASEYLQDSAKFADSGAKVASSFFAASEAQTDASITAADHAGSHAKRAAEDAKSDSDDAQKYIDTVLDFYRQYESSAGQATQATLHRS